MAYNLTDDEFLHRLITDPSWCLFFKRAEVQQILPYLARAYITVGIIQKELAKSPFEELKERK